MEKTLLFSFNYSSQILKSLERTVSPSRLSTYTKLVNGNVETAIKLYAWNTALSEALYSPIQGFEITLRNTLHNSLATRIADNWFDVYHFENREREQIIKAKNYLYILGKSMSVPNVIAALNFGFWAGILDRLYENNLWRPYLRQAFKSAPNPLRRKQIFVIVDRVRRLRNRIAHHEPILKRNLGEDHEIMLELIGWLCKDTESWVRQQSRFEGVWKNGPL